MTSDPSGSLIAVLEEARDLGFLGPGPVDDQIRHASGYLRTGAVPDGARVVDLGSGGGVPGLVLASERPDTTWLLLDSNVRRTAFLRQAVADLGFAGRVRVWEGRAEVAGRDPELRAGWDVVVSRGFAGPAVTAECAAPLLRLGGTIVVSEPPDSTGARWPDAGLRQLGLGPAEVVQGDYTYVILRLEQPCPDAYPRRVGVPGKRPLF